MVENHLIEQIRQYLWNRFGQYQNCYPIARDSNYNIAGAPEDIIEIMKQNQQDEEEHSDSCECCQNFLRVEAERDSLINIIKSCEIRLLTGFNIGDEEAEKLRKELHYPDCWDTVAYPTLFHAIYEQIGCGTCGTGTPQKREIGEEVLQRDIKIGATVFRKGIKLNTLINAAERWNKMASDASCLPRFPT